MALRRPTQDALHTACSDRGAASLATGLDGLTR